MTDTLAILGPALAAGALVLITHVALGRQVLARGIIFIDLAVAQAAATGALLATSLLDHAEPWLQQGCALAAALLMTLFLHELEKRAAAIQEALIGGSFVVLASSAVLITSQDAHGSEHIQSLLAGQILWVDSPQLWALAGSAAIAWLGMLFGRSPLWRFYLPFAIAITAAVQAVGVYLVFASLIFPALAVRLLPARKALFSGYLLGVGAYAAGLMASLQWDLPTGPVIVVSLALVMLVASRLMSVASAARIG